MCTFQTRCAPHICNMSRGKFNSCFTKWGALTQVLARLLFVLRKGPLRRTRASTQEIYMSHCLGKIRGAENPPPYIRSDMRSRVHQFEYPNLYEADVIYFSFYSVFFSTEIELMKWGFKEAGYYGFPDGIKKKRNVRGSCKIGWLARGRKSTASMWVSAFAGQDKSRFCCERSSVPTARRSTGRGKEAADAPLSSASSRLVALGSHIKNRYTMMRARNRHDMNYLEVAPHHLPDDQFTW